MPFEAVQDVSYTTSATATGGRGGSVRSGDGVVDLLLGKPGSVANPKANPETLFAAGFAACFSSALNSVARRQGLDVSSSTVTAQVSLGATESGFGLAVDVVADLPGLDPQVAQLLVDAAHEICPYSKATRGNIAVTAMAAH